MRPTAKPHHLPLCEGQSPSDVACKGQTLISVIIGIFIFIILANALFTLVRGSFSLISFNRARITGRHLAQEKLEFLRNLSYDDVGTVGGIPAGPLAQEEVVQRNGLSFTIKTDIIYIDDPFDQTTPTDLLPTDYKRVRVDVSWEGIAASHKNPVVLVSDISPKGVETTAGGGTLSIFVIDANGEPVPQADITVTAATTPAVNLTLETGDNGRIILPGAQPCTSCYQISTTKDGYSTERTYATSEIANPSKPHLTILAGQLTEVTFSIDRVSTLSINSKDSRANGFSPLGPIAFQMRGNKTIGTDTSGNSVYKYDQSLTTNGTGTLSLPSLEWDNYQLTTTGTNPDISGMDPLSPLNIAPNTNTTVLFSTEPHTTHSLFLTFVDENQVRIASVSATLDTTPPETILSGQSGDPDFGQTFFSDLSASTYQLTATASGFIDYSGNISVSGKTQETVVLTPQ
jgi:hypothetical protein